MGMGLTAPGSSASRKPFRHGDEETGRPQATPELHEEVRASAWPPPERYGAITTGKRHSTPGPHMAGLPYRHVPPHSGPDGRSSSLAEGV